MNSIISFRSNNRSFSRKPYLGLIVVCSFEKNTEHCSKEEKSYARIADLNFDKFVSKAVKSAIGITRTYLSHRRRMVKPTDDGEVVNRPLKCEI